jgi:hypothetical protein
MNRFLSKFLSVLLNLWSRGIIIRFVINGEMGVPCGRPPFRKQSDKALSSSVFPSWFFTISLKGKSIDSMDMTNSGVVLPKKSEKSSLINHLLSFLWCLLFMSSEKWSG